MRLVNGAQLPFTTDPGGSGRTTSGLTVTTPQPLYVKGNYNVQTSAGSASGTNTANTYPAALMGDAITVLSANWSDTNTSSTTFSSSRHPLCHHRQCRHTGRHRGIHQFQLQWWRRKLSAAGGKLERRDLQYNGSIVVMFPSQYATGLWQNTVSGGNSSGSTIRPTATGLLT